MLACVAKPNQPTRRWQLAQRMRARSRDAAAIAVPAMPKANWMVRSCLALDRGDNPSSRRR